MSTGMLGGLIALSMLAGIGLFFVAISTGLITVVFG